MRMPRAPTVGYDTLKVLTAVSMQIGEPRGKYLASITAPKLAPGAFLELDRVSGRLPSGESAPL